MLLALYLGSTYRYDFARNVGWLQIMSEKNVGYYLVRIKIDLPIMFCAGVKLNS